MTHLEAFAERLTREMLVHWHGPYPTERGVAKIAERMVREFVAQAADQYMGADETEKYLDEPEKP